MTVGMWWLEPGPKRRISRRHVGRLHHRQMPRAPARYRKYTRKVVGGEGHCVREVRGWRHSPVDLARFLLSWVTSQVSMARKGLFMMKLYNTGNFTLKVLVPAAHHVDSCQTAASAPRTQPRSILRARWEYLVSQAGISI
jgi:hypothetical protein